MDLNQKWLNRRLTEEHVRDWIFRQPESITLSFVEIKHVAMCMHHIYQWHMRIDGRDGLGHFLTAIVRNDFMEACRRGDSANLKALYLYMRFICDNAPHDWQVQRNIIK